MDLQQHWVKEGTFESSLLALDWLNADVLELGAGTGVLTKALLDLPVRTVKAVEIDETLTSPSHDPRLVWVQGNIFDFKTSDLMAIGPNPVLVGFVPYNCLSHIIEHIFTKQVKALLMAPPKWEVKLLELGFKKCATLGGEDFIPESRGIHDIWTFSPQ